MNGADVRVLSQENVKVLSAGERSLILRTLRMGRWCLIAVLGIYAFFSLVSVIFSFNEPGWGYDVADVVLAALATWTAYSVNKDFKQASAVLK